MLRDFGNTADTADTPVGRYKQVAIVTPRPTASPQLPSRTH